MGELPKVENADKLNEHLLDMPGHEMPHGPEPSRIGPTAMGKRELLKQLSLKLFGVPITDHEVEKLVGPPPGDKKNRKKIRRALDPEVSRKMAELSAQFGLEASVKNGEELAAACREGTSDLVKGMKPLRLRTGPHSFTVIPMGFL
ncbi:MAG: hypothetical protein ACAH83_13585 [Alphaproteobacteria bacterium]